MPPEPVSLGQPVRESFRVLGIYICGQILVCLILAALYAAGFWLIHVPYWWVVGILGGCAAVVPRVGALVPLGVAVFSLYLASEPAKSYLLVLGVWLVIQAIGFFVLMPRLIARPLGLKELPMLAALLLGSLLFGPIGLLLAVPVLAIGLVFWRHFRNRRTGN